MDGHEFEEQVRRVARWVWNLPPGEGQANSSPALKLTVFVERKTLLT